MQRVFGTSNRHIVHAVLRVWIRLVLAISSSGQIRNDHDVISDVDKFDKLIAMHAGREVATVDAIGRAILLLGFAEFESRCDVPVKVVINEAVELAKRYGSPDCYRFVNAVLDKAAKAMPPQRQCDARG